MILLTFFGITTPHRTKYRYIERARVRRQRVGEGKGEEEREREVGGVGVGSGRRYARITIKWHKRFEEPKCGIHSRFSTDPKRFEESVPQKEMKNCTKWNLVCADHRR